MEPLNRPLVITFVISMIIMLTTYSNRYDFSLDWEVTTTGEVVEFPAWELTTDLNTYQITGAKYLLTEQYEGSEIKRQTETEAIFFGLIWLFLCLFLAASTYLKRYGFFAVAALFVLLINRLNLHEIGLFGINSKLLILLPFVLFIVPLLIFHEYKKATPFLVRFIVMLAASGILLLGVDNTELFTNHIMAHSLFSFSIVVLLFLFVVSEEILFGILYLSTTSRVGRKNHIHFILLSLVYLLNLTLYYLDRIGVFESQLFYFDPFILITITSVVALWSLRFKEGYLANHLSAHLMQVLILLLGIMSMLFLSLQFIKGYDAVQESFHYFILYFHLGFGVLFFLYILSNFIDPLIRGFEVYKIAYKERNLPYATARLGGLVAILAFYFLSNQEPYNLLRSGYYNDLSIVAQAEGNHLLAREYILQSSFLGYNTHYPNYLLGFDELKKGNDFAAKTYFLSAANRFPSDYALVNYGNLDSEINTNKVQARYEERLRSKSIGELTNNLGLIHLQKGQLEDALQYFDNANPSDEWNNAPVLNKWHVLNMTNRIDSSSFENEYLNEHFGIKSNIIYNQAEFTKELQFIHEGLANANPLHRQAYLLNATHLFDHDSIESWIRRDIDASSNATANDHLRLALAIHLYKKGEVNRAFLMLDYLQANSNQFDKGVYLDALGTFALDQHAYKVALEFFQNALEAKHIPSLFGKLEAMAQLGRKDDIPTILLQQLKRNPELTEQANLFLDKLERFSPLKPPKESMEVLPDTVPYHQLMALGKANAFNEGQVLAVVDELEERDSLGGYDILVDAIEINPYSEELLKAYAFKALEWNFSEYADQALLRLQAIISEDEYIELLELIQEHKATLDENIW